MTRAKALWDRAVQRWQDQTAPYLGADYRYKDEILLEEIEASLAELSPSERPTLHSGLARDLKLDMMFRDMLLKFEQGSRLTNKELRLLIQFFGVLVVAGDMLGQPYALFNAHVQAQHRKLIDMAAERGWSQGLLNMYGVMVRDLFQRIF